MNRVTSATTFAFASLAVLLASSTAFAQYTDGVVKIGVLTDMASLYADNAGPGSVVAAKLAVEDFGAAAKGMKVEIDCADHQNKPDIGSSIANSWFDVDKVDVIVDVPNSAVALAVSEVAKQKNKLFIASGPATLGPHRSEVQRQHHPLDLRHLEPRQRHRQGGGQDRRRYMVLHHRRLCFRPCARARHRGGRRGERRQGARPGARPAQQQRFLLVPAAGAELQAKVIGLANAGGDTINSIKQAAEFGIVKGGQSLAGLLVFAPTSRRSGCRSRRASSSPRLGTGT